MDKNKNIEKYLSSERLNLYFFVCGRNVKKGLELYQLNICLAASFVPLLSILEISLRNAIDIKLKEHFKQDDWFALLEAKLREEGNKKKQVIRQQYGQIPKGYNESLESAANSINKLKISVENKFKKKEKNKLQIELRTLDWFKKKSEIEKTIHIENELSLNKWKTIPSSSQMIAETTLGFWTTMFKAEIYRVLKGSLLKIFSNRKGLGRKKISFMLEEILNFRNKVAHHESLFFINKQLDLGNIKNVKKYIEEILSMLNEDLTDFSNEIFIINKNINDVNSFINDLPKHLQDA